MDINFYVVNEEYIETEEKTIPEVILCTSERLLDISL